MYNIHCLVSPTPSVGISCPTKLAITVRTAKPLIDSMIRMSGIAHCHSTGAEVHRHAMTMNRNAQNRFTGEHVHLSYSSNILK